MRLVSVALVVVTAACGSSPRPTVPTVKPTGDAAGAHRAAVASLVQPLIDAEITTGIVVGLYDAGKTEIYGFGKGPDGQAPTGTTLFELGAVTQIYTNLLFADAIQRRVVTLDTGLAELLPPGVTAPASPGARVTLGSLATNTAGFPRLPPSLGQRMNPQDPYASYGEDRLYADLIGTQLLAAPGTALLASNYGEGVLGFVLGKKIGGGFANALTLRVLAPLGLASTFLTVPPIAKARRAVGTDLDLKPVPNWTWDALASAGGLVSSTADQLALIDAELDAASGSKQPLRAAMRLSQEEQLPGRGSQNVGLGWQIDGIGRYWHNGGTGGFRSFVGFDPKTRRGIVILSSSAVSLVDHIALDLYKLLANEQVTPVKPPSVDQLAPYVGTYQLGEFKLVVSIKDKRMYITGQGEQAMRLIPLSDHEMWFEEQQAIVVFEKDGDKVARAVFVIGPQRLAAPRVAD
ncbi:MAG: serine hydrolase domain-containing protein [Kofleriaceae bacterium]